MWVSATVIWSGLSFGLFFSIFGRVLAMTLLSLLDRRGCLMDVSADHVRVYGAFFSAKSLDLHIGDLDPSPNPNPNPEFNPDPSGNG